MIVNKASTTMISTQEFEELINAYYSTLTCKMGWNPETLEEIDETLHQEQWQQRMVQLVWNHDPKISDHLRERHDWSSVTILRFARWQRKALLHSSCDATIMRTIVCCGGRFSSIQISSWQTMNCWIFRQSETTFCCMELASINTAGSRKTSRSCI